MNKIKLKNLDQVWMAMDDGKTVYWTSDAYKLIVVPSDLSWREHNGFEVPFSNRCGHSLRVTCISNYFGSLLLENEIPQLYVKE